MATLAPLRWGLLSTAHINSSVIPAIRSSKKSQLIAVASRDAQKAGDYARALGIPRFYSCYEDLLAAPDIDVVYISLPNSLHAEWSIKSMLAGKNVLCEKPITTSSNELDEVADIAQSTGRIIAEAFMYRHHPQTQLVKEMVRRGEVGTLQLIRGSYCYLNTRRADPRLDPKLAGGSLWDVGCYPISYACFLTGDIPSEVFGQQVIGPTGVDLLFAGQLIFSGGVICQFDCSFISESKAEIEIVGDRGRITINEPYKPGLRTTIILQESGKKKTINIKGKELYLGEIEDIENAILSHVPPRISLKQSGEVIQIIECLYLSARRSKPVKIQQPTKGTD